MNNILELNKVSKNFITEKKIKVLNNLSYKFKRGKIYSLMGPSGSGKSTLLNIISLIDRPSSGSVKFDDKQVYFKDKKENDIFRSKNIGIIYQNNNLLSDFTALENIYLASLAVNNNKNVAINNARNLLKKIGLSNRSDHLPSELSGGEAQRISIARAIINDPKIILADEPTGSLDTSNAKNIFQLLKDQKRPDRLIIFATHNRFFANKADYLLEIKDGSIKTTNV